MFGLDTCFPAAIDFVATLVVLMAAQVVYVMLGFGSGLIALGALAVLFPDIRDVVVMLLIVNAPAEIIIVIKERKNIQWQALLLPLLGIAVGIPIGSWVLQTQKATFLLTILGGLLVVFGLFFFTTSRKTRKSVILALPKWLELLMGTLAGLLAALFGTGGPPLIIMFQASGANKTLFRANLMVCFFFFSLLRVPSYWVSGLLTEERIVSAVLVLPAVLLGALIGNRIHVRMSEGRFKQVVSLSIVAIGIVLLSHLAV
ncbi:MAG: sulfite exporter TauE/SafE family protein [Myxococcota bacterium]|nr:sulfite exporter TauE/SafE family protein [Myxococcota bacterium]